MSGRDSQKTIDSFKELRNFYIETLDPSGALETQYLEFNGDGWARSGQNPVSKFSSFWAQFKQVQELGKIVGSDVINFGFDLVPSNIDPNGVEWFEIKLEPLFATATKRYHFTYLKRGSDLDKMLIDVAKADDILKKLISKIENK